MIEKVIFEPLNVKIILLCVYGFVCLLWGIFAIHKNATSYSIKPTIGKQILTFIINFFLFPYCWYYAKKHKKI